MTAVATRRAPAAAQAAGRVAIYCRISSDGDGRGLGVERQRDDCLRLASILGLDVAPGDIIEENDVSASGYSNKPRTKWDALMQRVDAGEVTHVLAYSLSRLTRNMIDREHLLERRKAGMTATTAQGQRIYPGMTSSELQMIRLLGTNDTAESDRISELVTSAMEQAATMGTPHGRLAYGWDRARERDGSIVETINDEQAAVIREAAQRLLAGQSLRSIARDFAERELPTPTGGTWTAVVLKALMKRERNAGRRVHRGVVVGEASWPAILDADTHDALTALFADPTRRTSRGVQRHLLSGRIVCGRCDSTRVYVNTGSYQCMSCNGVKRLQEPIDRYVVEAVCARLTAPDALDFLAVDAGRLVAARAHLAALRGKLARRTDMLDAETIDEAEYVRSATRIRAEIAAAELEVQAARPVPAVVRALAGLGTVEATREAWNLLPLEGKRDVVRSLLTITLLPTARRTRSRFDEDALRLDWTA